MKKLSLLLSRLLTAFIFTVVLLPTAMADTITIAGDEFGPYNTDPNSPLPGYGVEIVKRHQAIEAIG